MAKESKQGKVLRIGVIQDGKIVQERLMKAGEAVVVGESSKASVVFPKTHLPPEFTLFQWTGKEYVLQFTEAMKGKIDRVGAANAVVALQNLREDPSVQRAGGVFSYPLTEQDRGKLSIDQVTILFQFVAPPIAAAPTPALQTDFRPRLLQEDDPVFLGFLGLWGAMGVLLGLWVSFTEPPEVTLDSAPELARLVVPPKVEEPPPVDDQPEAPTEKPEEAPSDEAPAEEQPAKGPAQDQTSSDARKSELIAQSKLLSALIGTTGEANSGMVVEDTLGGTSLGNVDEALKGALGATTDAAAAGYKAGAGGKGTAATIDEIGGLGGGKAGVGGGSVAATLKASVNTGDGAMDELVGDKATVTKTVRGFSGQIKYCYESRLKVVPDLGGRVEIGWSIGDDGSVSGVYTVSNDTGDAELAKCIEGKIRRWKFPASASGDVQWPFVLRAQGG